MKKKKTEKIYRETNNINKLIRSINKVKYFK